MTRLPCPEMQTRAVRLLAVFLLLVAIYAPHVGFA